MNFEHQNLITLGIYPVLVNFLLLRQNTWCSKLREEMFYLLYSLWKFQSITSWLQDKEAYGRGEQFKPTDDRKSNKSKREEQVSFTPLYCRQTTYPKAGVALTPPIPTIYNETNHKLQIQSPLKLYAHDYMRHCGDI